MKKIVLLVIIVGALTETAKAQRDVSGLIEVRQVFGGYSYYQYERKVDFDHILSVMKPYPLAHDLFIKGRKKRTWGLIMEGVGTPLFFAPFGQWIAGEQPDWFLGVIGLGIISGATITIIKGQNKMVQAVSLYNNERINEQRKRTSYWSVSLNGSMVGLNYHF